MRSLSPPIASAMAGRQIRMCYLVEGAFPTGPVRFSTTPHSIEYSGVEYWGGGRMLDIKFAQEDSSLQAHACEITLDGLDAAAVSLALNEPLENAALTIHALVWEHETNVRLGWFLVTKLSVSRIKLIPPTSSE